MGIDWLLGVCGAIGNLKKFGVMNIQAILLVFFGGGLGSVVRYGLAKALQHFSINFPWATLCANAIGCFLIGMLLGGFSETGILTQQQKLVFVTGFCGGLTTFSTFTFENYSYIKGGQLLNFFSYSLLSFGLCLGFVLLGHLLAKSI